MLEWLYKCLRKLEHVGLKEYEYRSFVDVYDVVKVMIHLTMAVTGPVERVLNVGGPVGRSRLQLAQALAKVLEVDLLTQDAPTSGCVAQQQQWVVSALSAAPMDGTGGNVQSPRNITMMIETTQVVTGVSFKNAEDYLLDHVNTCKALLYPHDKPS